MTDLRKLFFEAGRSGWIASLLLVLAGGCNSSGTPAVSQASVDETAASAAAMEQYDKNHDGSMDREELVACAPLAAALATFDANNDSKLSAEETSAGIAKLFGSSSALATFNGTVTLSGRPLSGARVRFVPASFLGEGLTAAEGVTDESGAFRPALADAELPKNLQGQPLIRPGLYLVEITHSEQQIPAKYNTATELGAVVDPTSRTGLASRFDLQL